MTNYIKPLIFAVLLIAAVVLWKWCSFKPQPVSKTETTAEKQLRKVVTGRDKKNEELEAYNRKYLAQIKADSATINYWRSKYTEQTQKGAGIEQRYRKKPTLATCDTLLQNKEERIAALKGNLDAARKDSLNKAGMIKTYAEHLFDKDMRIDTLAKGWEDANRDLRKEKGKKWGVGVQAGYGAGKAGFSPYIGIGISYTPIRF